MLSECSIGCFKGGWTQVALREGCKVVSCDLLDHCISPATDPGVVWIKGDMTDPLIQQQIQSSLGGQCQVCIA